MIFQDNCEQQFIIKMNQGLSHQKPVRKINKEGISYLAELYTYNAEKQINLQVKGSRFLINIGLQQQSPSHKATKYLFSQMLSKKRQKHKFISTQSQAYPLNISFQLKQNQSQYCTQQNTQYNKFRYGTQQKDQKVEFSCRDILNYSFRPSFSEKIQNQHENQLPRKQFDNKNTESEVQKVKVKSRNLAQPLQKIQEGKRMMSENKQDAIIKQIFKEQLNISDDRVRNRNSEVKTQIQQDIIKKQPELIKFDFGQHISQAQSLVYYVEDCTNYKNQLGKQ